jgi:ribonucleoside-diphosphate reductase alpha chain
MKFKDESGKFDVERLKAAARIFITAQEIVVDNSSYPTRQIAANSHILEHWVSVLLTWARSS